MSTGPDRGNLRQLAQMMPSFMKGLHDREIVGKGVKATTRRPRKMCKVCVESFDFTTTAGDIVMEAGICEQCAPRLADGFTAFVSGDRFCFAKSDRLKDMAGTIQPVSPETMDALDKQFKAEWKKIPDEPKSENPESTAG